MPTTVATSPTSGQPLGRSSRPPSTPDSPTASQPDVAQRGDELAVDDAAEDRRGDLERGRIGDPEAALEAGLDAQPLEPLGHALAAAVDEHDGPLAGDRGDLGQDLRAGPRASSRRA